MVIAVPLGTPVNEYTGEIHGEEVAFAAFVVVYEREVIRGTVK
jgi:hypothetical protein